ncbi:MAG: EAL domain-containing protein [Thermoanaerobaculia bacterium]|nr:EAL domain-containing protein [Thermoanaerobaculia bacterium]
MVVARRLSMVFAVACLLAAVALVVRLTGTDARSLAAAGREADAVASRAAASVGSLLVFQDADGAVETVKDLVPGGRLVSVVVLNRAGLPAAVWQAPAAGETHVTRAVVTYEGKRVGALVLGVSLAPAREAADRERRGSLAAALVLAALGAGAATLSVLAPLRKRVKQASEERERLTVERDALAESVAESDVLLQRERKDRRFVEGTLSGRDLLERDRRAILEHIARGEPLRVILPEVAALVEHQRPRAICAISPLRQGVRALGSAGSAGPFGSPQEDIPLGSTTPPLARAVEEHRLVVTSDVPGDPLWSACRETFAPHGIKACWTVPIETGGGVVLGTLSVLLPEVRRPERADTALLSSAASLAAIAIEQRQLAEQLLFQARFDSLTSLPNRLSLEERLRSAVSRAAGSGTCVVLAYVDLDRFKQVNDTFGHAGGDELLREVAFRLSSALAEGDVLARMGGDEFCVLRVETPGAAGRAEELPKGLLEALKAPFDLRGDEVFVGASIGVSVFPDDARDVVSLQRHADAAMYAAKAMAGNGYRVFGPDVILGGGERLRLENDLRRAVTRGELEIVYQAQVDCDGTLVGAEALLRWNHPELGEVRPSRFIPVAEESGLIQPIGLWAFEEVCARIAAWRREGVGAVPVSVNLSPVQFSQADLAETLERLLGTHGVPGSFLRLEVTESLLVKDVASTMALLGRLKALGVGLAVDDFGTGYSSLSYLQLLPIDELKIDQAFLRDLGKPIDPAGRAAKLVQTMVTLGHDLGLVVVAEGVETPGQIEFLRQAGCDRLQGFGLSAPVSAAAFTGLLASARERAGARRAS